MVNGSGNCGLAPGSQGQSGVFAFQKCTWASTMVRFPAGCGRAGSALEAAAAPAASVAPNSRRVIMMSSPPTALACRRSSAKRQGSRDRVSLDKLIFGRVRPAARAAELAVSV